ncbi:MAG: hypothetical protein WCJ97_12545 [Phycisphaerae bacterium]
MKNQYFGDVNDYCKYGLLRALKVPGNSHLGVCWMLTPDDGKGDGEKRDYLNHSEDYLQYDPDLYDWFFKHREDRQARNVNLIEKSDTPLLGNAKFYAQILNYDREDRQRYFQECWKAFDKCGLIYFDPDNGLEVPSVAKGWQDSSKYVYWDEVRTAFRMGASVLIYQHFPKFVDHDPCTVNKARMLLDRTTAATVYTFSTPHAFFLLAVQQQHQDHFRKRVAEITPVWEHVWEHVMQHP